MRPEGQNGKKGVDPISFHCVLAKWELCRTGANPEEISRPGQAVRSKLETVFGQIPLLKGEGGPHQRAGVIIEGSDPSPAASRHPLPSGEGFANTYL